MCGLLVVISGPSGAGKGTVVKQLTQEEGFAFSVSVTTRSPRTGEACGLDYFFVTNEEFAKLQADNNLLEHAEYVGNYYGTPRKYVDDQIANGKVVLLDIEVVGALQVKEQFPDAVLIFLIPPTLAELERRLTGRKTEDAPTVELRLKKAMEELSLVNSYDYLVVNDDVTAAADKIKAIVTAEQLKPIRRKAVIIFPIVFIPTI